MSLTNTKSLLAKLLASENLTVEHGNYSTASMDVKNRVLRLPIWKEMSGSLYDLMVLHEVGHALYTPEDGWHKSASKNGSGYKSFLNVVEDARIERKIKDKYPGGRKSFTDGYLDLIQKDFFGLKGIDPNSLNLIDRINLYFKGGTVHDIQFSDEEMEFVKKVSNTLTWDDVVRVTDELYNYAKDHDSETDMSDHSSINLEDDGNEEEGEEGEYEWNENYDLSDYDDSEKSEDKMKNEDLESGEEENENSGSSTGSGEGEGESEENGKSAGDSAGEDGDETDNAKAGGEKNDQRSESNMSSLGSGAGVGNPFSEDYDPRSLTDDSFREREEELVSDTNLNFMYGNLPVANLKDIIVDYKELHEVINSHYKKISENTGDDEFDEIKDASKNFIEFRSKNKKTVEYLAKEFEMKKAADAHSRTATANSGIIDTSILHTYKYNEHIFKKINVTSDGKNHGLVMVVDWSGSMNNNIKGTIEQMMVLVMFAKRVNIPFEVFLFSDSYISKDGRKVGKRFQSSDDGYNREWTHADKGKNGDLIIDPYNLLNVFSSKMRANELHNAYINMTAIASCYDYESFGYSRYSRRKTLPDAIRLGGTPLNASLLTMNTFLPEFKAKNNVQIVNLIYLTDGDSNGGEHIWYRGFEERKDSRTGESYNHQIESKSLRGHFTSRTKVIIRDTVSKREYELGKVRNGRYSRGSMTNTLVEVLRDKHGVNVVNFYIVPKLKRYDMFEFATSDISVDQIFSNWRKDGHVIGENYGGWSELYLIKGGKDLNVEDSVLEVKDDAKKGEIKRAFSKFNKGKLKNRLLLSKFVDMIAA